jgi:parallel beta-helix repeat protein
MSGFTIQNGSYYHHYTGIYIDSNYNTITGNNIISNNDHGIYIISPYNIITGNNISLNGQYAVFLLSAYNTITGNIISNNKYGIVIYESRNNIITDNIISNNVYGIDIMDAQNNIITDNIISNNDESIISNYYSNNNIISGNIISDNNKGIFLGYKSRYETITANNISNNTWCGISVHDSTYGNIISDNSLFNNGLYMSISYGNNISNNTVNGKPLVYLEDESDAVINIDAGQVILRNCNNVTIQNQNLSNATVGINLIYTNNCLIKNNNINFNSYRGINFRYSTSNIIYHNNINFNSYRGISFSSSTNNIIYHNNLIKNGQNAYDKNNNSWDNGYPSGGNFWSDYKGADSNGDGIGDTPYPIPGGDNEDRYPLGNFPPSKPNIYGPLLGKPGVEYDYSFNSTDPEGDDVSYYIEWGDETSTGWTDYFPSGDWIWINHSWDKIDFYPIRCIAKDIYNEGDWSDYEIDISVNKAFNFNFNVLDWFLERFPLLERLLSLIFAI